MRYAKFYPLLLPLALLILGYFRPITALNQDLGRHLLTGQIITQTLLVPSTNLFSYTHPDFPFINHHWFSEVIFYLIASMGGYSGLFILSLLLIIGAFNLIVITAARKSSILPLAFLGIVYLRVLFERTDLRPELFSFLFLSLMVSILYRYRESHTRLIFLLLPLQLLWTNSHIYFPIGILLTTLFMIDIGVTHRKNLLAKKPKLLFLVLIGMGLVTLLNPHGITGALYPLTVMQNYGYTIEENQTPFFLQSLGFVKPSFFYLGLTIIILFSTLILTVKKARLIDWLLAIIFSVVALSAVRNFPLFVFATFIPSSYALSTLLTHLPKLTRPRNSLLKYAPILILLLFFFWQAKTITIVHPVSYGVYEDAKGALDFIQREKIHGPIFNNFDIGSYIESRLYPRERVFIDGRPEAYPVSFIQGVYIPMQQDPALFLKTSNSYRFNAIIFSHTDQTPWAEQFIATIIRDKGWRTVYLDPTIIVLIKNTNQNAPIISRFSLPDSLPMHLPNDERLLRQAAHFYSITSQTKNLEKTLLLLLQLNPKDCPLLNAITSVYIAESHPSAQIYQARYNMYCGN